MSTPTRMPEVRVAVPPRLGAPRPEFLPLSSPQRRLWFVDRLQGTSVEYNITVAWRLRGRLDRVALERAHQRIVDRHESLRTYFPFVDVNVVQAVATAMQIPLELEDLSGLSSDAQCEWVRASIDRESRRPFELARGPLVRIRLLRLGDEDHVFVRATHHIVTDAWSGAVFARELAVLYGSFVRGEDDPLPPLPVQYADFTLWQQERLVTSKLEKERTYWTRQLQGIPERLGVPVDRAPVPAEVSAAGVCRTSIGTDQVAALKALSVAHGATLYVTLLAAYAVLLARCSGCDDIVIGTHVANRESVPFQQLIGFFVNTLALRVRPVATMRVAELLRSVRQTTLDAHRYQELPFENLVQALAPPRRLLGTPVVQTVLAMQNVLQNPLQLEGLQVENLVVDQPFARFDLQLYVVERKAGLELSLVYKTALYDEARIDHMLRRYVRILDAMRSDPVREIGALDAGSEDAFVRPDSASTAPNVPARAGGTRRLPRTSTEAAVWRLFVEALGHEVGETMSAEDSFFELGGHSFMAADLVTRIAHVLRLDVPLRLLFEAPSVAALSARLSAGGNTLS